MIIKIIIKFVLFATDDDYLYITTLLNTEFSIYFSNPQPHHPSTQTIHNNSSTLLPTHTAHLSRYAYIYTLKFARASEWGANDRRLYSHTYTWTRGSRPILYPRSTSPHYPSILRESVSDLPRRALLIFFSRARAPIWPFSAALPHHIGILSFSVFFFFFSFLKRLCDGNFGFRGATVSHRRHERVWRFAEFRVVYEQLMWAHRCVVEVLLLYRTDRCLWMAGRSGRID